MRNVMTSSTGIRASNRHPAWDDENLAGPFGGWLARAHAMLTATGVLTAAMLAYHFLG